MALVYNRRRRGPQTHILVIGVGGYRHLIGGPRPMRDPLAYGGLEQLSSPPVSAVAMRDRLLATEPDAWRAPLGSVDLLISPHPEDPWPAEQGVTFTEPTAGNIKQAFDRWMTRSDSDSGNVAVLYFCGHGLQGDEQYVLASDFGANEHRAWENAIAIDSTIKGLWHCKARTQCVFVDACRQGTIATQASPRIDAPALRNFSSAEPVRVEYPLVLKAVDEGLRAFGRPREASYFTQALLKSVLGGAAEEEDGTGDWVVTTGSLAFKFDKVLAIVAPHLTPPRPDPGRSVELYRPPKPPSVDLTVGCEPPDALETARLVCRHQRKQFARERAPLKERWTLEVEAGYYEVEAQFEGGPYRPGKELLLADPPRRSRDVNVQ
jgi:Caspase domain